MPKDLEQKPNIYEKLYQERLSDEEIKECESNLLGFFETLIKIHEEDQRSN